MLEFIDNILNRVTMYRLVLYYLLFLICAALILSLFNLLAIGFVPLIYSTLFICSVCWLINTLFGWVFNVPTNAESALITGLILVVIITPIKSFHDTAYFAFTAWASVWAVASKYIFAIKKKHIFNPAAFAVALTAIVISKSASWWVGTAVMLPFVLLGGILTVRKIRRTDLVVSFIIGSLISILGFAIFRSLNPILTLQKVLLNSPLLFFAFVMLTEPLTTPPTKNLRIYYGFLVGLLFAPQVHIGPIFSTPELALLAGNIFSYLVSPKQKLMLALKQVVKTASDTYDFIFESAEKLKFIPGQYLEWTLATDTSDSRGNRRYFTLASSPTESEIVMGVKFYPKPSSFKIALSALKPGQQIIASQLAGDFTLPKDQKQKLVFIAGGIGVTPFRSMIKYLIDSKEKRDITFFYSNKQAEDISYKEIFDQGHDMLGIKTVYTLTNEQNIPSSWQGKTGPINEVMITQEVPDYKERMFYISGPHAMVTAFKNTLKQMGVKNSKIKTDFFPGFA